MEVFIFKATQHRGLYFQGLITCAGQKDFMFRSCWSSNMLPQPLLADARDEGVVDVVVVVEVDVRIRVANVDADEDEGPAEKACRRRPSEEGLSMKAQPKKVH
jgi:hypothetical protein